MASVKLAAEVSDEDMILDVGPQTAAQIAVRVRESATILWNGPLGVFEHAHEGLDRSFNEPRAPRVRVIPR